MPVWQPAIPQGLRPHLLSWAGYDFTSSDTDHHGVPSLGVTVVLSFAEPINCGWLHGGERHRLDVLVSGLHTTPALIQSRGRQQGLEWSIHPLSARRLLGPPAGELAGSMVDVKDLPWPRHLLDQLRQSTWPRRFHLLAAFLAKRLDQHSHTPRADMVEALSRIHRAGGVIPISDLAQYVGLSRRRLSSPFALETGLSPKQVARIARFKPRQRPRPEWCPALRRRCHGRLQRPSAPVARMEVDDRVDAAPVEGRFPIASRHRHASRVRLEP